MSLFPARRTSTEALADGSVFHVGAAEVRLKVNPRARRVSLRLDGRSRRIIATAPSVRRLAEARAFAFTRRDWIEAQVAALPAGVDVRPGALISLEGAPCRLERAAMRIAPRIRPPDGAEPARILASGDGDAFARAVVRALKAHALGRLKAETDLSLIRLGYRPDVEISVMDARARWGSCRGAHGGRPAAIRYNWRLILAPPEVLAYVVAHEVAHLEEANHSPAFWRVVERLYGDVEPARRWLRANGRELHALRA